MDFGVFFSRLYEHSLFLLLQLNVYVDIIQMRLILLKMLENINLTARQSFRIFLMIWNLYISELIIAFQ